MSGYIRKFSVGVRRRETAFYDKLYTMAKFVHGLSFPCIRPLHSLLYYELLARNSLWHNFWRVVYYEPMFKSQCVSVGPKFRMEYAGNGTARIVGDLQLSIGSNVTIFDNTAFVGLKVMDKPELHIGDNSYIGPEVFISVGREIRIGSHCMIGSTLITDNPGHSLYGLNRLGGRGNPDLENIKPVSIGDFCWLPLSTFVYPGAKIGDGVVALAGTHINKDIPAFCLIAGQPAAIVRKLSIPPKIVDFVGKERYESYLASHKELNIG